MWKAFSLSSKSTNIKVGDLDEPSTGRAENDSGFLIPRKSIARLSKAEMWRILSSHWTPSRDFFHKSISKRPDSIKSCPSKLLASIFKLFPAYSNWFQHLRLFWAISPSGNFTFPQVKTESDIFCCTNLICAKIFSDQLDASLAHDVGSEVLGVEASTGGKLCPFFLAGLPSRPNTIAQPSSLSWWLLLRLHWSKCKAIFIWSVFKAIFIGENGKLILLERFQGWLYQSDFKADVFIGAESHRSSDFF